MMFRPYGTLNLLSTLMCEVIKDHMENHTEEETWSRVARDILLDIWTVLLVVPVLGGLDVFLAFYHCELALK